jgi:aryl-alcohol dehydrogenase-like predicted oxidoreductase
MNKLILGTAQFGSDYGIKHDGQPSIGELEKISRVAWDGGIRVIHTSWQYNLPKICEAIFDQFEKIEKYKNNPRWFTWGEKRGISVYDIEGLDPQTEYYDILQIPLNILDDRFLELPNWITSLIDKGKMEIHARSVFLQGLLLTKELPAWISTEAMLKIHSFRNICNKKKLQYYEAALGWVLGLKDVDHVIVGVNSAEQLKQLLEVKPLQWDYDFSIQDENVLDPNKWPNKEKERIEFLRKHNSINYG